MKETMQNVTNASIGASAISGVATATGFLDTVNRYAPLIGIILTAFSLVMAVVFFIITHRREKEKINIHNEAIKHRLRQELLTELIEQGSDDGRETSS